MSGAMCHSRQRPSPSWLFSTLSVLILAGCAISAPAPVPESPSTSETALQDPTDIAAQVHDRMLILDAHADIVPLGVSSRYGDADGSSKVTPQKLRAGGVDVVVMAAAVGPGPRNAAGDAAARAQVDAELQALEQIAASDDQIVIARSVAELQRAHAAGQQAFLMGFQNARALEGKVESLDELYAAGVRVFALTHIGHNEFADSSRPEFISAAAAYEPIERHGGLSVLGQHAVARINALGGLVDVSQLSKKATLQAIASSSQPVIASHSNVQTLSDVARNLSDEEIDAIGRSGGVMHIAAFTPYLLDLSAPDLIDEIKALRRSAGIDEHYTYPYELYWEIDDEKAQYAFLGAMRTLIGPANIDRLIDHVDYLVERIGIDHVGLATDFNHGGGITGFKNAAKARNLTAGLLRRGYSETQISKIWSGNFLRVLAQAEQGRSPPD